MEILAGSPVIAATGMDFEARIALGAGIKVIYGQNREKYLRDLHTHAREVARGVISFGTAGGISPSLRPGDVIVASSIVTAKGRFQTHSPWSKSLLDAIPHAHCLPIFGAEAPVMTVLEKEALWHGMGVGAVDMESRAIHRVEGGYRPLGSRTSLECACRGS
jgi:purine-nucleoside phosphorylase